MDKSKRLFLKPKRSLRRRLPPIGSGDRIDTIAIKQARILSSLPFLNNERQFEKNELVARTTGLRTRKK